MKRVAFIISHPIQYYVPLLQELSKVDGLSIKVFYTWGENSINKYDPSYNKVIEWDIPLLSGYEYEFLKNIAKDQGTHHFNGIDNPTIIESINNFNPDKIVVFGWSFKSHLKVIRKFSGKIPIYFRGDSHLLNNSNGLKSLLRKLFLTWVYKHIDYAISVGTNNRNYYKWLGLKEHQLLFAPHAIDDSRFKKNDTSETGQAFSREKLNIPADHVVFLYCGSFGITKNIQQIIEAKINLINKKCSLLIVGNGERDKVLKEMAKSDQNIQFLGFVNQKSLPSVYHLADVLILFSEDETWGLVVNEAMASGLAIITSDRVGCAVDLVNENGFIVETNNVVELEEKMNELVQNRDLLNNFKSKSAELIRKWSMDELVNSFKMILLN